MSRCDYDGIFYRLFCVTLLAIAFTFTVILTNVFIDIDGILTKKDHEIEKPKREIVAVAEKTKEAITPHSATENEVVYHGEQLEVRTEVVFQESDSKIFAKKEDILVEREEEDNSRTKRSLDTTKFQYHGNHPKIKELLNNKLATLLEELDDEESQSHDTKVKNAEDVPKPTENMSEKTTVQEKPKTVKTDNDMLHLAMHNILLQGIIGHMEISDVYKKVHELMNKFENKGKNSDGTTNIANVENSAFGESFKDKSQISYHNEATDAQSSDLVETTFFEELIKCEELQKQLEAASEVKLGALRRSKAKLGAVRRSGSQSNEKKVPKMLIRTVIDIKTVKNENDSKAYVSSDNIKGLIKLIYNGKPIEFSAMKEDDLVEESTTLAPEVSLVQVEKLPDYVEEDSGNIVDNFINKALSQYLKNYPTLERRLKSKRLKRHVKTKKANKKKDDEVYIEIETHFDSKRMKGKKKKLIQQVVEKIRTAIHSQMESMAKMKKVKKEAVMQIRKRIQSPLKPKATNVLLNKFIIPLENIVLRESEPISKVVKIPQPMPLMSTSVGENIGTIYHKPGFFSETKSINSGELGSVNLEFDKVLDETGIPQRLQKPLNTDNIGEQNDNVVSLGNLKFYVKDIDGAGFSIGFNQYVGETPDPDSIKVFTGIQQLINDVDKKYEINKNGEPDKTYDNDQKAGLNNNYSYENVEVNHELRKRDAQELNKVKHHDDDYHYNEYRLVFDSNYQPYDSYSEIFEDVNKKVSVSIVKDPAPNVEKSRSKTEPLMPLVIDGDLFTKPLNPSEIFSLANLLDRKKRATVLQFSNLKTRTKLNRYLNTVKMAKYNKKKRFKRQIDKIRIIASDSLPRLTRRSEDENVFIVSDDDNIFADRAILREQEREREAEDTEQDTEQDEHHDYVIQNNAYEDNFNPYRLFSTGARQNTLMSKYPHVFLEEISQSKEDSNAFYSKLINGYADAKTTKVKDPLQFPFVMPTPLYDPMIAQSRQIGANDVETTPKSNYKLMVKIVPKNSSDDDPGFKQVHTSINKSTHRNGLLYSSQVNVTELSKVENVNPSLFKNDIVPPQYRYGNIDIGAMDDNRTNALPPLPKITNSYLPLVNHIKQQQEQMKLILKKHKQRIDDQLNTLNLEKQHIDSMIMPFDKKEMIDVQLPLTPPQVLHLSKDEAGQLISKALMKLRTVPQINDVMNLTRQNQTEIVHELTTKKPNVIQTTPAVEMKKDKIFNTIQRNENLTSAILYKIEKNSDMLQNFMQRLLERLAPATQAHTYPLPEQRPPNRGPIQDSSYSQRHLRDPFFGQTMPLEMHKNASHNNIVSIPFVYAYQEPYPNSKPNAPVASVVYQGHIHTNAYNHLRNTIVNSNLMIPEKEGVNRTHFFMDEPTELFKILPMKKSYDISRVKSNKTQTFIP